MDKFSDLGVEITEALRNKIRQGMTAKALKYYKGEIDIKLLAQRKISFSTLQEEFSNRTTYPTRGDFDRYIAGQITSIQNSAEFDTQISAIKNNHGLMQSIAQELLSENISSDLESIRAKL